MKKGIVYFSDNILGEDVLRPFREQLKRACNRAEIVWVTKKPIGEKRNIVLSGLPRHHRSICLQILTGLRHLECDVVYMAEHDVFYHPSHFEFVPFEKDVFYYNTNRWWLRMGDGLASHKKNTRSLSNLVCFYDLANDFYTRRMILYVSETRTKVREEPGKHKVRELPDYRSEMFSSKWPNVDVRHGLNYTRSNRFKENDPDYEISDSIPGWGRTKGRYEEFISGNISYTYRLD